MKVNRAISLILIVGMVVCFSMRAESVSVKLRGKLTLAGILAGLTYVTYTLVSQDRHTVEELQFQLGPPKRIIEFERGFEKWSINYYRDHYYMFLNNRFIRKKAYSTSFLNHEASDLLDQNFPIYNISKRQDYYRSIFNRCSSVNPKLLSPFLWHQQLIPKPVSSGLLLLEDGHLQHLHLRHSHLK